MPAIFNPWVDYRNAHLKRTADGKAYAYRITGVQIDADGAPDPDTHNQ